MTASAKPCVHNTPDLQITLTIAALQWFVDEILGLSALFGNVLGVKPPQKPMTATPVKPVKSSRKS